MTVIPRIKEKVQIGNISIAPKFHPKIVSSAVKLIEVLSAVLKFPLNKN